MPLKPELNEKISLWFSSSHPIAIVNSAFDFFLSLLFFDSRQNYLMANSNDGYASSTTSESNQPFARILESRTTTVLGTRIFAILCIINEVY